MEKINKKHFKSKKISTIIIVLLKSEIIIALFSVIIFFLWRNNSFIRRTCHNIFFGPFDFYFQMIWLIIALFILIGFPFWIYKLHYDLCILFNNYPIKPWNAVIRIFIPGYSIWGIYNIFNTMVDRLKLEHEKLKKIIFLLQLYSVMLYFIWISMLLLGLLGLMNSEMMIFFGHSFFGLILWVFHDLFWYRKSFFPYQDFFITLLFLIMLLQIIQKIRILVDCLMVEKI